MRHRQLSALILGSALITLDGTATTIALPAIGRDLLAPIVRLQWIANASLLALAALLIPAGTIADRFGQIRVLRIGLAVFVAASFLCASAWSDVVLIGAKLAQGAGGALVLPAALAVLRRAYEDATERTRIFGVWAAWTGAASAVGPLLAGLLVDVVSWRAVFLPSIVAGLLSVVMLKSDLPQEGRTRPGPIPWLPTAALMVLLGAVTYLLMEGSRSDLHLALVAPPVVLAIAGGVTLIRDPRRKVLFPRELLIARNCVPANVASFGLYFGLFGLSFLLVLYVQQRLQYSALWAAVVLLPISIMLLFAERFGRLTTSVGTRWLAVGGALVAAAGIAWISTGAHPVPFWSHLMLGTAVFGLGISAAVSALTHAAVAAVPEEFAGAASGLNHAVVRAAGLVSVALLGSIAAPGASDAVSVEGFQRAVLLCAAIVAAAGLTGSVRLRDDEAGGVASTESEAAAATPEPRRH